MEYNLLQRTADLAVYKNCYKASVEANYPQAWLDVVYYGGKHTTDSLAKMKAYMVNDYMGADFDMGEMFRIVYQEYNTEYYKNVLQKGVMYDKIKTPYKFVHFLKIMREYAKEKYNSDVNEYYQYLSCLKKEEVTGDEWWFNF
jgi:hypothetical protein